MSARAAGEPEDSGEFYSEEVSSRVSAICNWRDQGEEHTYRECFRITTAAGERLRRVGNIIGGENKESQVVGSTRNNAGSESNGRAWMAVSSQQQQQYN